MGIEKDFFFEVRGLITAKDESEATDYIYELLKGKTSKFEITYLEEDK